MKKNLKIKLEILFLINLCFLSPFYYIYINQLGNLEKDNENYEANDYKLDAFYLLGTSNVEIYGDSFEISQMIEITSFIEGLTKKQDIFFFIFCFNAVYLSFEFLFLFKNPSEIILSISFFN